jgi:hypothetical protein
MTHRGRKSSAELSLVVSPIAFPPLRPPPTLNPKAAVFWREIVGSVGHDHFRRCDAPLLAEYCNAAYLAAFYASQIGQNDTAFKCWESCAKLMASLSTKLKVAPSTRLDRKVVGGHQEMPDTAAPWEAEAPA